MDSPYIDRPNIVSRYRERKLGRNTLLFGNDVEVDANSRSQSRTMFDGDMLIHGDLMVSFHPVSEADECRNAPSTLPSSPSASTRTG